jgi:hypothetical protein
MPVEYHKLRAPAILRPPVDTSLRKVNPIKISFKFYRVIIPRRETFGKKKMKEGGRPL